MFGFGKKNKADDSANNKKKNTQSSAVKRLPPQPSAPRQTVKNAPMQAGRTIPVRQPVRAAHPARPAPKNAPVNRTAPMRQGVEGNKAKAPVKKEKKARGPLITKKDVKYGSIVLIAAILLAFLMLCMINGIMYAIHHVEIDFGYDVTVRLENGASKPPKFECDKDNVFREGGKEPYISITKLADHLSLSTIGNGSKVKFYKMDELTNYVAFEDGSCHVVMNGEKINLSSPVHIRGTQVYVPISFFERYTTSVAVSYFADSHTMSVDFEINEELSTPKRKVLEEFRFVVTTPSGLTEMTEEERNEYAALS